MSDNSYLDKFMDYLKHPVNTLEGLVGAQNKLSGNAPSTTTPPTPDRAILLAQQGYAPLMGTQSMIPSLVNPSTAPTTGMGDNWSLFKGLFGDKATTPAKPVYGPPSPSAAQGTVSSGS